MEPLSGDGGRGRGSQAEGTGGTGAPWDGLAGDVVERGRDQRRAALRHSPRLTGLDYVRVRPLADGAEGERRWAVDLHFVPAAPEAGKRPVPAGLAPEHLAFTVDGRRDERVEVEALAAGGAPEVVTARVRTPPDLSPDPHDAPVYRLRLVGGVEAEVDPLFASALVRLEGGAATTSSLPSLTVAPAAEPTVPADYLAKDYESFRRLLLERMAFHMPAWVERNPSDLGVTLVEVLAYAADYLSYRQDAVATEAYLETARRRVSVRRHARLLDFLLREGTNARAWVQVEVRPLGGETDGGEADDAAGEADVAEHAAAVLPAGSELLTTAERQPGVVAPGSEEHRRALESGSLVFQTLHPLTLHSGHQALEVHTWGADDYVLPAGATGLALVGSWRHLAAGDVLVLETRQGRRIDAAGGGPQAAGGTVAADPRERHAVRLAADPAMSRDPLTGDSLTEIRWHAEDALPRPFPVARAEGAVRHRSLTRVRGNVVLCDHGETVEELLPPVPAEAAGTGGFRYAPRLGRRGLAFRVPPDPRTTLRRPAAWALDPLRHDAEGAREARPDVVLYELPPGVAPAGASADPDAPDVPDAVSPGAVPLRSRPRWRPRFDLLGSSRSARHFVVEVDEDGWAHLRFGDGDTGRAPRPGSRFLARYRVGGGPRGNVGSHSIRHLVLPPAERRRLAAAGVEVTGAVNQIPAAGGRRATAMDHARVYAPDRLHADDFQERCATEADSARLAARHPEVAAAAARHRWTGSAHTVEVYALPARRGGFGAGFEAQLRDHLEPRLLVGWDLEIRPPRWVPLDVEVTVWPARGERAERLYGRLAAAGGLFAADAFGFGRPVYASHLTSRLLEVPGVADVRLDEMHRWGRPPAGELEAGVVAVGPLEVARLDNDPEAPQHGTLRVRFAAADEAPPGPPTDGQASP